MQCQIALFLTKSKTISMEFTKIFASTNPPKYSKILENFSAKKCIKIVWKEGGVLPSYPIY